MKTKIIYTFLTALCLASCVKYDAKPFSGKTLPRISGYKTGVTNDWIYFNLRTGQVFNAYKVNGEIREGEQRNRLDWDLAFCGYRLRTNSGTSGNGQGGAIDLGYGEYKKWKTVAQLPADATWTADDHSVMITISTNDWNKYLIANGLDFNENPWFDPNSGPQRTLTDANPVLANAMKYLGPPPTFTPSYHTYAIRTADGKRYFKLQIISWYNADVEIGDTGGQISYYIDELKQE